MYLRWWTMAKNMMEHGSWRFPEMTGAGCGTSSRWFGYLGTGGGGSDSGNVWTDAGRSVSVYQCNGLVFKKPCKTLTLQDISLTMDTPSSSMGIPGQFLQVRWCEVSSIRDLDVEHRQNFYSSTAWIIFLKTFLGGWWRLHFYNKPISMTLWYVYFFTNI